MKGPPLAGPSCCAGVSWWGVEYGNHLAMPTWRAPTTDRRFREPQGGDSCTLGSTSGPTRTRGERNESASGLSMSRAGEDRLTNRDGRALPWATTATATTATAGTTVTTSATTGVVTSTRATTATGSTSTSPTAADT